MQPALISYRDSKASPTEELPLRTWVTLAEALAGRVVCAPRGFDEVQFSRALTLCRGLTRQEGPEALERMILACATAGVAVVLVPNFDGCRLSSASKWLVPGRRALIALSIRYRRDDQLYFSLFREAGAILAAHKKTEVRSQKTEGARSEDSSDSCLLTSGFSPDTFAREFIVPREFEEKLESIAGIAGATEMSAAIKKLARRLGIAPGLLVGRLQHDGIIDWKHQNSLKRQVDLSYVLGGTEAAQETWPTQEAATQAVMADLNLDAGDTGDQRRARARVRRAAARGALLTNGEDRYSMRFEPGTLAAWRLNERDRDLDAEDREEEEAA